MSSIADLRPQSSESPVENQPAQTFADLALSREVQLAVQQSGYITPSEVQSSIIPELLAGRDVLAQSQTGTGKTAAFALPILSRLLPPSKLPQVLVLAPTRELALQVAEAFEKYGAMMPRLRVLSIYGGADYQPQLRGLNSGVDIVVGTPGRVIDHLQRGTLSLDNLQCLVLDEADEMLSMGFQEEVEKILQATPDKKQIALFSATMPGPIRHIADQYLKNPATVTIGRKTLTADSIEQRCVFVPERLKMELLTRLLELEPTDGVIVFTKTKDSSVQVAEKLARLGFSAAALNGDLPQMRRQKTVEQLKDGHLNILVATDVAARGLDVSRISHVINYDLPHDGEAYVHRIGRTGRAGRTGVAYIFLTNQQQRRLRDIERLTKKSIDLVPFPSAEIMNRHRAEQFMQQLQQTIQTEELTEFHRLIAQFATQQSVDPLIIAAALAHQSRRGQPLWVNDRHLDLDQDRKRMRDRDRRFGEEPFSSGKGKRSGPNDQRGPKSARQRINFKDRSSFNERNSEFDRSADKRKSKQRSAPGMQCYQLAVGLQDGVRPGNIVGAIANESGISGREIGPIDIRRNFTLIHLPEGIDGEVLQVIRRTWVAGKQLKIREYHPAN